MKRSRNWCGTINNPADKGIDREHLWKPEAMKYLIVGMERGATGTPHYQFFVRFLNARRFDSVKKIFAGAHLEVCRGSPKENIEYCKKEGDYVEHGEAPLSKTDIGDLEKQRWTDALQAAKEGRIDDIPADITLRHYRTIRLIQKDYMEPAEDANSVTGIWLWGESGAGKSRKARLDYPQAYLKMANKWWDGYQNQENVILDDLDKNHHVLGHHLKIWSDRYAFIAETKGGALQIRPSVLCVTSQYQIHEIWDDEETRDALKRRFKCIQVLRLC